MNRKAFNRINYGLFLVGSVLDGKYQGCVVQLPAPDHLYQSGQVLSEPEQEQRDL